MVRPLHLDSSHKALIKCEAVRSFLSFIKTPVPQVLAEPVEIEKTRFSISSVNNEAFSA